MRELEVGYNLPSFGKVESYERTNKQVQTIKFVSPLRGGSSFLYYLNSELPEYIQNEKGTRNVTSGKLSCFPK